MSGFNFAPRGWAMCDGQLLPINQYQALFSLLGTTYGGDGRTSFALPDLRDRAPLGPRNGPGLSNRSLGERGGNASHALTVSELPHHGHTINATSAVNNSTSFEANLAGVSVAAPQYRSDTDTEMGDLLASAGGGQPHNNRQPYLAVRFIIALTGLFPSRN